MEKHLRNIWTASAELEMLQFQTDQAHDGLVQAMCQAMAARIPPDDVAAAANMSLGDLFDTLRRDKTNPAAGHDDAVARQ